MALRKGNRRRKPSNKRGRARRRRTVVLKVLAVVCLLALLTVLALISGDEAYHATVVGWTPLIAAIAIIAGAFAYLQVLKRSLRLIERSEMSQCARGDRVGFTIRFRNTSPLFFFRIEGYFFVADVKGNPLSLATTTVALAPFEAYDMQFKTRFEHIGTFQAGLSHVVVTDYLRLFTATLPGPERKVVQVTPHIAALEGLEYSNETLIESSRAVRSVVSDSLDYAGVRDYAPGDPLKTIHWKLSAMREDYLTRLFEESTTPGVAVIMDFYAPTEHADTMLQMFDCVVESAFSVADHARRAGMDVELHYVDRQGDQVRLCSWNMNDIGDIIAQLPPMSDSDHRSAEALELLDRQVRSNDGQNNIVVCSANVSARMVSSLIDAKARRRNPMMFAVRPRDLEDSEVAEWARPLGRLDAAGIGYVAFSDSHELRRV